MTNDENDKIVDTYNNQSEVERYQNNNYVVISSFVLDNVPDPSYTSEWDVFVGNIDFDEIAASAANDKPRKGISTE